MQKNETQISIEDRDYFVRFLRYASAANKKILTVALVSDRVDRYNTIIEPEGCITDFSNVIIDYNHFNKETGCQLKNRRVENITLDNGQTVRALVGDIEVYRESMLRNEKGEELESVMEALNKRRIKAVSVRFKPIEHETYSNDKTKITRYRKWELVSLALLDIPSGQGDAIILDIRALTQNEKASSSASVEANAKGTDKRLLKTNLQKNMKRQKVVIEKQVAEVKPKDEALINDDSEEKKELESQEQGGEGATAELTRKPEEGEEEKTEALSEDAKEGIEQNADKAESEEGEAEEEAGVEGGEEGEGEGADVKELGEILSTLVEDIKTIKEKLGIEGARDSKETKTEGDPVGGVKDVTKGEKDKAENKKAAEEGEEKEAEKKEDVKPQEEGRGALKTMKGFIRNPAVKEAKGDIKDPPADMKGTPKEMMEKAKKFGRDGLTTEDRALLTEALETSKKIAGENQRLMTENEKIKNSIRNIMNAPVEDLKRFADDSDEKTDLGESAKAEPKDKEEPDWKGVQRNILSR